MARVRLIHWNESEAVEKAEELAALGHDVDFRPFDQQTWRELKSDPLDVMVIDLNRLPSHGRDVALAIRSAKPTRHIPIVFVDGIREKVEKIKTALPDATYTNWRGLQRSIRSAIQHRPESPVVPKSQLAGYSGTPLPKKLGFKADMTVALIDAPDSFLNTLGPLPASVAIRNSHRGQRDLTIWFVDSSNVLENRIDQFADRMVQNSLWIAWPKKTSGVKTDLTQKLIRKVAFAAGLVDYKICAIDKTWSAMKFSRRR